MMHTKLLVVLLVVLLVALFSSACSKTADTPAGDEGAGAAAPPASRPAQRAGDPGVAADDPRIAFQVQTRKSLEDLSQKVAFVERVATFQTDDQLIKDSRFLGREVEAAKKQLIVMEKAPADEVPKRQAEIELVLANLTERVMAQLTRAEEIKPDKPARLPNLGDAPTTAPAVPK